MGRIALATVDSTNVEALRRISVLDGPTWISATSQNAGRGRRAQAWASPPGNLYATFVMRVDEEPAIVALRSFVAAISLRDALTKLIGPGADLALKWPNDVLLNGGKLAGILLEAQTNASGRVLVIGIGVNLISHPERIAGASFPPVSLHSQTGLLIAPDTLLCELATAYARREAQFLEQGFPPIRTEWLAHAARLGHEIRARTGHQIREGVFETIDDTGNLILRMTSGTVAIPAAEVFF